MLLVELMMIHSTHLIHAGSGLKLVMIHLRVRVVNGCLIHHVLIEVVVLSAAHHVICLKNSLLALIELL